MHSGSHSIIYTEKIQLWTSIVQASLSHRHSKNVFSASYRTKLEVFGLKFCTHLKFDLKITFYIFLYMHIAIQRSFLNL